MKVTPKSYAESLMTLCKGKSTADIDRCVKEFLGYLSSRGFSRLGGAVLEALRILAARESHSSRVVVTSAHELEKHEQEVFEKVVQESFGKKSTICFTLDPSLIGGFRIKSNDTLVDASVAGKIHSLRDHLKHSAVIG